MTSLGWLGAGGRAIRTLAADSSWAVATVPWLERAGRMPSLTLPSERMVGLAAVPWDVVSSHSAETADSPRAAHDRPRPRPVALDLGGRTPHIPHPRARSAAPAGRSTDGITAADALVNRAAPAERFPGGRTRRIGAASALRSATSGFDTTRPPDEIGEQRPTASDLGATSPGTGAPGGGVADRRDAPPPMTNGGRPGRDERELDARRPRLTRADARPGKHAPVAVAHDRRPSESPGWTDPRTGSTGGAVEPRPGGALGDLVRRWSNDATGATGASGASESAPAPTARADEPVSGPASARPHDPVHRAVPVRRPPEHLRGVVDSLTERQGVAHVDEESDAALALEAFVERALDRVVRRDAERHMIQWSRT